MQSIQSFVKQHILYPPGSVDYHFSRWQWGGVILLGIVLAALPLPIAAAVVGGAFLAILMVVEPTWALYAAVLSVPIQTTIVLPGDITVTQVVVAILAATWGVQVLAFPERRVLLGKPLLGIVALLWALVLAVTTTPYSQIEGFKETFRWLPVLLVYLAALNKSAPLPTSPSSQPQTSMALMPLSTLSSVPSSGGGGALTATTPTPILLSWKASGLIISLILATTINAVVGLVQCFGGIGPESFTIGNTPLIRAYGTIGKPNSFAGYLNMGWPLALAITIGAVRYGQWRQETGGLSRPPLRLLLLTIGAGVASLLTLGALLASFSRGGWLGAIGGGIAMMIASFAGLGARVRQVIWRAGGTVAAIVVTVVLLNSVGLLPQPITERFDSTIHNLRLFDVSGAQVTPENFAVIERMAHIQSSWEMFLDYTLTGIGPGNFTLAYEGREAFGVDSYAYHPWYESRGHTHNYYLHIATEAGVVGVAAYLLLLMILIVQAHATLRRTSSVPPAYQWSWLPRSIAVGCCGIIGAVIVHNLFENLHVLNMGVQLGAVWGLLTALQQQNASGSS
jgi:O-antigen ligase